MENRQFGKLHLIHVYSVFMQYFAVAFLLMTQFALDGCGLGIRGHPVPSLDERIVNVREERGMKKPLIFVL